MEISSKQSPCLIISMVGLPARGKSYISRKLRNFLSWSGNVGKIFNFGMYRRSKLGNLVILILLQLLGVHDHTFFDPNNETAKNEREQMANDAVHDVCSYLNSGMINFI